MSILYLIVILCSVAATLLLVYFLFKEWIKYQERSWAFQLKMENNKAMSPLRISAFERTIIMLERITPTSLVMRQNIGRSSAGALQLELIKSIREEFDLNVSLQMYMSEATWEQVRRAKEETTELVKVAFSKVKPESSGVDLCNIIFQLESLTQNMPIKQAIAAVRQEIYKHY
jgi:hypothetical protein